MIREFMEYERGVGKDILKAKKEFRLRGGSRPDSARSIDTAYSKFYEYLNLWKNDIRLLTRNEKPRTTTPNSMFSTASEFSDGSMFQDMFSFGLRDLIDRDKSNLCELKVDSIFDIHHKFSNGNIVRRNSIEYLLRNNTTVSEYFITTSASYKDLVKYYTDINLTAYNSLYLVPLFNRSLPAEKNKNMMNELINWSLCKDQFTIEQINALKTGTEIETIKSYEWLDSQISDLKKIYNKLILAANYPKKAYVPQKFDKIECGYYENENVSIFKKVLYTGLNYGYGSYRRDFNTFYNLSYNESRFNKLSIDQQRISDLSIVHKYKGKEYTNSIYYDNKLTSEFDKLFSYYKAIENGLGLRVPYISNLWNYPTVKQVVSYPFFIDNKQFFKYDTLFLEIYTSFLYEYINIYNIALTLNNSENLIKEIMAIINKKLNDTITFIQTYLSYATAKLESIESPSTNLEDIFVNHANKHGVKKNLKLLILDFENESEVETQNKILAMTNSDCKTLTTLIYEKKDEYYND